MTVVLPWIAIFISSASVVFTFMNMRDRRQSEKTIHVSRVSVEIVERRTEVTYNSWEHLGYDITVRNDGPSAITIDYIARAYGDKWVLNQQQPVYWQLDFVRDTLTSRLLRPGEELSAEAPADRSDASILGPVVTLVDTNGNSWQRTEWGWRELTIPGGGSPPPRRHLWFDRQPWLQKLDARLYRRAQKKVLRRPRRVPWEIRVIDAAWGYRPGPVDYDVFRLPWDAPRTWRYPDLFPDELGESPTG